jgi:hypothetical protein
MGDTLRVTVIATGFDHARVSLPDSHNKMYPTAGAGYGYQNVNGMAATGHNQPYGAAQPAHNQRGGVNNYGYGNGQNDPRHASMNQNSQAMGRNDGGHNSRSQGNHLSNHGQINQQQPQHPVAAGLSLRAPYEVGQPINNNFRRTDGFHNQQTDSANLSYGRQNQQSSNLGGGSTTSSNQQQSHQAIALQNAAQTAHQLRTALASNSGSENLETNAGDHGNNRTTQLGSKNEFEELTQWTLELSRQANGEASTVSESLSHNVADPLAGLADELRNSPSDESDNDRALRLARELADITPDEGDFETPAFLRRKDDSLNRPL